MLSEAQCQVHKQGEAASFITPLLLTGRAAHLWGRRGDFYAAHFMLLKEIPVSAMLKITLPDGSVREVAPGTTPADIAAAIGPGLAKAAIAARVDGELRDIMRPLEQDAALALVTAKDEADALELARRQRTAQVQPEDLGAERRVEQFDVKSGLENGRHGTRPLNE